MALHKLLPWVSLSHVPSHSLHLGKGAGVLSTWAENGRGGLTLVVAAESEEMVTSSPYPLSPIWVTTIATFCWSLFWCHAE
jgi:hypothetical protein